MILTSRRLALLLAAGIAIPATTVLFFIGGADEFLAATLAIVFFIAFALNVLVLESLIFRKVRKLAKLMDKLMGKDGEGQHVRDPLKNLTRDIRSFAERTQKEIEEHKKLEAFRQEFIADVSHELKTPIFAAQGFVHTLLDGAMKDKTVREKFLKKAAKSLDRLDRLVSDLLTLSQIETGQIKMQITEVDLEELTREVLDQFEGKLAEKGMELRMEPPPGKAMVYADHVRIVQVVTNLISNAINYSSESKQVIIRFALRKKWVTLSVRDFGEGIPKEHLGRIFERFYRVDKSRSRELGGTGLGLAIVKHILEGHRTKPEVESVPGEGSTFSFRLRRVRAKLKNGEGHEPETEK
jgi:two-component system phosphate regulon sensor histidine kinase PhoR